MQGTPDRSSGPGRGARSAAGEVLAQLRRSVSIVNVFPPNSPSYRRAVEGTILAFERFHTSFGPLALDVGADRFAYSGCALNEGGDDDHYLGRRLYRDGIRQVVFQPGLTEHEILTFLRVAAPGRHDSRNTDTVTAFLSDEFQHLKFLVSHEVFTEEVMLEEDQPGFSGSTTQQSALGLYRPLEEDLHELADRIGQAMEDDLEAIARRMSEQAARATDEAVARQPGTLHSALAKDLSAELKQAVLARLVELAREAMEGGDMEGALELVADLSELPVELKMLVRRELTELFHDRTIELIVERLDRASGVVAPALKQLLLVLGQHDLPKLAAVACRISDATLLVDVMVSACRDRTDAALALLQQRHDPKTVAVMAAVLARLGDPRGAEPLAGLLQAQPPWVRSQIVDTLAVLGGRAGRKALEAAVGDEEPFIRMSALKALARHGDAGTLQTLRTLVDTKTFARREAAEQQATFRAMLCMAPARATDIVLSVLRRTRWFGRSVLLALQLNLVEAAATLTDRGVADCLVREGERLGQQSPLGRAARDAARRIHRAMGPEKVQTSRRMVG